LKNRDKKQFCAANNMQTQNFLSYCCLSFLYFFAMQADLQLDFSFQLWYILPVFFNEGEVKTENKRIKS